MNTFAAALASGYGQAVLNLVVQVAMVPLYLRYLGTEGFGLLTLYLAGASWLAIGYGWASNGSARLLGETFARGEEPRFALVYAVSMRVAAAYAGIVSLVAIVAVTAVSPTQLFAVALFALYLLLAYLFAVDRLALSARGRQAEANAIMMVSQLAFVGLTIAALHAGFGLPSVAAALAAAQAISLVLARFAWRRSGLHLPFGISGDGAAVLRTLAGRQGIGFVLAGILVLSLQADALALGWFAPLTAVAAFALVWKVAEAGVQLLWRVPDTLQPFLVHHDAREDSAAMTQAYGRVLLWSWLAGPLAGLALALFGPWLITLWVGAEHAPTDRLAYWAAGGAVGWLTVARPALTLGFAMVRLRPLLVIMAVELVAKIALMAALVSSTGFAAPLLALNLTHLFGIAWAYQRLGWRLARVPR
jgi:O-antigen/teichoic acid export membrane protein